MTCKTKRRWFIQSSKVLVKSHFDVFHPCSFPFWRVKTVKTNDARRKAAPITPSDVPRLSLSLWGWRQGRQEHGKLRLPPLGPEAGKNMGIWVDLDWFHGLVGGYFPDIFWIERVLWFLIGCCIIYMRVFPPQKPGLRHNVCFSGHAICAFRLVYNGYQTNNVMGIYHAIYDGTQFTNRNIGNELVWFEGNLPKRDVAQQEGFSRAKRMIDLNTMTCTLYYTVLY